MRTIDADALSAFIGDLRSTLHKEQTTFRAMTDIEFNTRDYMLLHFQYVIDNAPTVEPFEPDYVGAERLKARQRGYEDGYHNGMKIGKTLNPKIRQGEWIENVERRGCFAGDKTVYSYTCPFCGVKEFKKYPFCHCGADMRGGRE